MFYFSNNQNAGAPVFGPLVRGNYDVAGHRGAGNGGNSALDNFNGIGGWWPSAGQSVDSNNSAGTFVTG